MATYEGQAIDMFRLTAMLHGLKAEARGMRLSRGISALKAVKRDFPELAKRTPR